MEKRPGWAPPNQAGLPGRRLRKSLDRKKADHDSPKRRLLYRGYDAFARGDIPTAMGVLADDITWHVPGQSPLAGDYRGHQEVLGFFAKSVELSAGTLQIDIEEILCEGEHAAVLCTVSAERNGQSWASPEVQLWRIRNGKAVEFREFQGDQQTEDEFWSS